MYLPKGAVQCAKEVNVFRPKRAAPPLCCGSVVQDPKPPGESPDWLFVASTC